jgi:hypothetical protein
MTGWIIGFGIVIVIGIVAFVFGGSATKVADSGVGKVIAGVVAAFGWLASVVGVVGLAVSAILAIIRAVGA